MAAWGKQAAWLLENNSQNVQSGLSDGRSIRCMRGGLHCAWAVCPARAMPCRALHALEAYTPSYIVSVRMKMLGAKII